MQEFNALTFPYNWRRMLRSTKLHAHLMSLPPCLFRFLHLFCLFNSLVVHAMMGCMASYSNCSSEPRQKKTAWPFGIVFFGSSTARHPSLGRCAVLRHSCVCCECSEDRSGGPLVLSRSCCRPLWPTELLLGEYWSKTDLAAGGLLVVVGHAWVTEVSTTSAVFHKNF